MLCTVICECKVSNCWANVLIESVCVIHFGRLYDFVMNLNDCQKCYLYFQTRKIKRLSATQLFLFLSLSMQNYWSLPLSANSGFLSLSKIFLSKPYLSQAICPQTWVFYKVLEEHFFFFSFKRIFSCLDPWKDAVAVARSGGKSEDQPYRTAHHNNLTMLHFLTVSDLVDTSSQGTSANTSLKPSLRMSRSASVVPRCRKVHSTVPV